MSRALIGLYIPIYLLISFASISSSISHNLPIWSIALAASCRILAITVIVLYLIRKRPNKLTWLWKTVPFIIIMNDLFEWWHDVFITVDPDQSLNKIITATIIGGSMLFPSWYLSARYGWRDEIKQKSE